MPKKPKPSQLKDCVVNLYLAIQMLEREIDSIKEARKLKLSTLEKEIVLSQAHNAAWIAEGDILYGLSYLQCFLNSPKPKHKCLRCTVKRKRS